uniref:Ovule protein n=1 Tax=Caenorhabditis tropicalis TaxID=1561998 RepID=A0A1I7UZN1_9PELO
MREYSKRSSLINPILSDSFHIVLILLLLLLIPSCIMKKNCADDRSVSFLVTRTLNWRKPKRLHPIIH